MTMTNAEKCKRYYYKNQERMQQRQRDYYAANGDKCRERHRVWCDANKKHCQEYKRNKFLNYLDLEHWKWEDVEGYDGFTVNTEVHHRREAIGYTRAQLIEQGQYYGCRADELICCTPAEHKRIHEQIDKFFKRNNYKEK